ncbi:MAG: fec operon regulator FecR [Ferruginibacter sp.]|nr:fec operon regulator FecR [Ferruginibacter sp.]
MNEIHPDQRFLDLSEKWLNGTITPEEEKEYAAWYNTIEPGAVLEVPASIATDSEQHRKKILQQINFLKTPVVPMYKRVWRRVAVAAAIIIIAGSAYLHFDNKNHPALVSAASGGDTTKNDIYPGTLGAILTIDNGKTVVLDTVKNGKIVQASAANVTKADGSLTFAEGIATTTAVEMYTLATPRARQQQLTLPDGTLVWLNAESSVKFPSSFAGSNREIEITGEAYLEVAKDASKPFIVHVKEAVIEVLGTHFNVMAYDNENALETTLLEGSVKFKKANNNVLLKPGQQSQLLPGSQIKMINDVNVDQVVAWKNGMQSFSSADIRTIMRQVERWYDVDVEYKGEISTRKFSGDIPRSANLSELMKLFVVNKIHFRMDPQHKKITVLP